MNISSKGRGLRLISVFRLSSAVLLCLTCHLRAHQGVAPPSATQQVMPLAGVQQLVLPPTDPQAELAADAQASKPGPLRYAVPRKVQITPATHGTWEQLTNGRLWRLRVTSPGATDLNLGFTSYWLPEGATLYIISESDKYYQGPYSSEHNAEHGQLWTPVVPGDSAVIELFVPAGVQQYPQLVLGQVGTGYRDLFGQQKGVSIPKGDTCEIDVVCPAAAPWTNEIRSVACISIGGSGFCSGTLVMDAASDFRPFLLTANHCGINSGNAATVVAFWNFQSATCGLHGTGVPQYPSTSTWSQNTSGSSFRAAKVDVDFCLIELSSNPSSAYAVYYAGWDRSGATPSSGVGIHHPAAQGKCISFSSSPFATITSCIGSGGVNTHWQVPWQNPPQGVTEPGSSGSAIFDATSHLVLGTLSGGPSACSATAGNLWDCYGKFSVSWNSGSSSADRLMDWLDPANTGIISKAGSYPARRARIVAAGAVLTSEGCYPANGAIDPGESVTVNFSLQNVGSAPTTNLVATLQTGSGVTAPSGPQSYGVLAANGPAVSHSFSFTANGICGGTITPTFQLQDGPTNLGMAQFSFVLGQPVTSFVQNFDAVTTPALPAGWTTSPPGVWYTTATVSDTVPNSAYTTDPAVVSDQQLISPVITVTNSNAQLSFRHYYSTESGFDGGVLEISIAGGAFTDILSAGGSFVTGGYDTTIPTTYSNPLGNRMAWSGDSGGFKTTIANLPPTAAGQTVQFSWRLGSDDSNSGLGWYVDTISLTDGYQCCSGSAAAPTLSGLSYSSGQFRFTVTGTAGFPYAVESSSNLLNWVRVKTNNSPFIYTQTNAASFSKQYYRAVFQP